MNKIIRMVYCLSIDLIGSTVAGFDLSTSTLDRFNLSLVNQLKPHLDSVGLDHAVLKFTGDGWLLMAEDPSQAAALCCLATIMASTFQIEMCRSTGIPTDKIPALRLAICAGRDIQVELPDKQVDWVGDSARRAVRASSFCFPNEILIDETVRYIVFRDFHTKSVALNQRSPDKLTKTEEDFALYSLGFLRVDAAKDFEAPEYFINTLTIIGKRKEAATVAKNFSDQVGLAANRSAADQNLLLLKMNRVLRSRLGFSKSIGILKSLKDAGILPDTTTYGFLLRKAPSVQTAKRILQEMTDQGLKPNIFTYTSLMDVSTSYEDARLWFERMIRENIEPDVIAYTVLMKKVPDSEYEVAKSWLARMIRHGITPDIVTYTQLIRKSPNFEEIESWVNVIREKRLAPDKAVYRVLIGRVPDIQRAKKLLKEISDKGIQREFLTFDVSSNYSITRAWIQALLEEGIQPDVITLAGLINKARDYDEAKALVELMHGNAAERMPIGISIYNTLIRMSPSFHEAQLWLNRIGKEGLLPDQATYRRMVRKSPNIATARTILDEMSQRGIVHDDYLYTLLIEKCTTYEERREVFDEMERNGIRKTGFFYTTLLKASANYNEGLFWIEKMIKDDVRSDHPYCALFGKDLSDQLAENILIWYLNQAYHPQEPIQAAITSFVRAKKTDQALRLALDYTHLMAARKLIRRHSALALSYFKSAYDADSSHPNANYALGVALMELGREVEAQPYLISALMSARPGPRRRDLVEWLDQIEKNTPRTPLDLR